MFPISKFLYYAQTLCVMGVTHVSYLENANGSINLQGTVSGNHYTVKFSKIFRSNRPGYLHPVCSELENSGIRVAVGDCSVTECRWRHPP